MNADHKRLRAQLKSAGFSDAAIDAAWPSWWNKEASLSPTAQAELRFALARKLGLSAQSLLGERVDFAWNDLARFKHLTTETELDKSVLSSFGVALGRMLLKGGSPAAIEGVSALQIRQAILSNAQFVDLNQLLSFSWAVGIPVVHIRVFPLATKSMHAMAVSSGGKYAILLGKDDQYPAPAAFTLAHELGHILLGHLTGDTAIVDFEAPVEPNVVDRQENEANAFALELLTGSSNPDIIISGGTLTASALAKAAASASLDHRIEPGTLALCVGYTTKRWDAAVGALKLLYPAPLPMWETINEIAKQQIPWADMPDYSIEYLYNVLQLSYD